MILTSRGDASHSTFSQVTIPLSFGVRSLVSKAKRRGCFIADPLPPLAAKFTAPSAGFESRPSGKATLLISVR